MSTPPASMTASELTERALEAFSTLERPRFDMALTYLDKAREIDPGFALPIAWSALWRVFNIAQGWTPNRQEEAQIALELAQAAMAAQPDEALGLSVHGFVRMMALGDFDTGLIFLDRARQAGPSQSLVRFLSAVALARAGESEEAIEQADFGLRLAPFDKFLFLHDFALAVAHYSADDPKEALRWARRADAETPTFTSNLRVTAAALGRRGDAEQARDVMARLLEVDPKFRVSEMRARGQPFRDPRQCQAYYRDLLSAGAPE